MTKQAGWYPDPEHTATVRYWDGDAWTGDVAPATTPKPGETKISTVVLGVAGGVIAALVAIWFVYSIATADDEFDCTIENVERSSRGEATRVC